MPIFGYSFVGWKTIAGAMSAFLLVTAFYSESIKIAWAFPAHRGYVQFTAEELQAYVLKQVGELRPVLNTLVKNQLVRDRREEEIRLSTIKDKVAKDTREAEETNLPRVREVLKESIARALEDKEKTEQSIQRLTEQIKQIPAN